MPLCASYKRGHSCEGAPLITKGLGRQQRRVDTHSRGTGCGVVWPAHLDLRCDGVSHPRTALEVRDRKPRSPCTLSERGRNSLPELCTREWPFSEARRGVTIASRSPPVTEAPPAAVGCKGRSCCKEQPSSSPAVRLESSTKLSELESSPAANGSYEGDTRIVHVSATDESINRLSSVQSSYKHRSMQLLTLT